MLAPVTTPQPAPTEPPAAELLPWWHGGAALCGATAAVLWGAPGLAARACALQSGAAAAAPEVLLREGLALLQRFTLTMAVGAGLGLLLAALARRWLLPTPPQRTPGLPGAAPLLLLAVGAALWLAAPAVTTLAQRLVPLPNPVPPEPVLALPLRLPPGALGHLRGLTTALLVGGAGLHLLLGLVQLLLARQRAGATGSAPASE